MRDGTAVGDDMSSQPAESQQADQVWCHYCVSKPHEDEVPGEIQSLNFTKSTPG